MKEVAWVASPVGTLRLEAEGERFTGLAFDGGCDPGGIPSTGLLAKAASQLQAYFEGRLQRFDLPLEMRGTPFQQEVWQALTRIPYGQTWSYARLAEAVGRPRAVRAVGAANGRNPIAIIVPCHRVIGKDGSLTGFGGGLACKALLLELEQPSLFRGEAETNREKPQHRGACRASRAPEWPSL